MIENKENISFQTPLKSAEIMSRLPEPVIKNNHEKETEQRIIIRSGRGIWVSRYSYDSEKKEMKLIWKEKISEDQEIEDDILDAIAQEFSDYEPQDHPDQGTWYLEVKDADQKKYQWNGSFSSDSMSHLSEYIRDTLNDSSLFLFDGNPDRIERIEITYQRQTEIPVPEEWNIDNPVWNYHEQLIIDRSSQTIEYTRFIADETDISTKYHVEGGISDFLDDFDVHLFSRVEGNPADVHVNPMESNDYQIKVITKNEGERDLSGSFDRKGLPMDFPEFMDDLSAFLDFYGHGEIFDDVLYNRVRRRENELVFCKVAFESNGPTYWYLADNEWYRPSDLVIVPAGDDDEETVARIVSIEYHTKDDAPYPMDQIKKIIRPFNDETDDHLVHTDL